MGTTLAWEPPGPGPWQQDSAHNPVAQTRLLQAAYPEGFNRGFEEAFGAYGVSVSRSEELAPAFTAALEAGRPAVIDVAVEPL